MSRLISSFLVLVFSISSHAVVITALFIDRVWLVWGSIVNVLLEDNGIRWEFCVCSGYFEEGGSRLDVGCRRLLVIFLEGGGPHMPVGRGSVRMGFGEFGGRYGELKDALGSGCMAIRLRLQFVIYVLVRVLLSDLSSSWTMKLLRGASVCFSWSGKYLGLAIKIHASEGLLSHSLYDWAVGRRDTWGFRNLEPVCVGGGLLKTSALRALRCSQGGSREVGKGGLVVTIVGLLLETQKQVWVMREVPLVENLIDKSLWDEIDGCMSAFEKSLGTTHGYGWGDIGAKHFALLSKGSFLCLCVLIWGRTESGVGLMEYPSVRVWGEPKTGCRVVGVGMTRGVDSGMELVREAYFRGDLFRILVWDIGAGFMLSYGVAFWLGLNRERREFAGDSGGSLLGGSYLSSWESFRVGESDGGVAVMIGSTAEVLVGGRMSSILSSSWSKWIEEIRRMLGGEDGGRACLAW
ncbi:hypothetical protein Tco_0531805 [Tanacetum coccineum]